MGSTGKHGVVFLENVSLIAGLAARFLSGPKTKINSIFGKK